ncbi:putative MFS family arabinose efflux permease [Herbihabitans rhizosphaerae]|uniref:Putative MFS family arabinose efflux permease n=2 Tax=Herbihabitans rhizosphaerae TaxID=1872711 RepID=A0A4Q7KVF2_9PSEU|nr:MFS transporter [Herbihabitans rhizosphaerae]RZS41008.1 putative MFS family arabinose efflux permease [Herbihabitans rhizosphaerae]
MRGGGAASKGRRGWTEGDQQASRGDQVPDRHQGQLDWPAQEPDHTPPPPSKATRRQAPPPQWEDDPDKHSTRPVRRRPPANPQPTRQSSAPPPARRAPRDSYPVDGPELYGDYDEYDEPQPERDQRTEGTVPHLPKKITVTRVAALRSRQLTSQAMSAFRRAAKADGAEKSGLTALTYATMLNYASDAAMAVALANVLFFSPTDPTAGRGKVALYLLITVAPFALVAPVIGPILDKIQRGRRLAMCVASAGSALACVVMALNFDSWLLYPGALMKMVLSKSFTVLKAAITPRVVPPDITLSKTNARLTVFGLAAGMVGGGLAAAVAWPFGSSGALWFTAVVCVVGAVQGMRIPAWVEVTEGEVPASIGAHPDGPKRQPMGRHVVVALWGNGTVRVLTGFLMMFAAFAVRDHYPNDVGTQLIQLGLIAGAAGLGSFVGNAIGARLHVGHPEQIVLGCVIGALVSTVVATVAEGVPTAALVGLVGAIASALAKISLDAVIQDDLPEASRASAFGRSETVLQLGWVLGGAVGVLLPPMFWLGFLVVSVMLSLGLVQTLMSRRGATLIPGFGGDRPVRPIPVRNDDGGGGRKFHPAAPARGRGDRTS